MGFERTCRLQQEIVVYKFGDGIIESYGAIRRGELQR